MLLTDIGMSLQIWDKAEKLEKISTPLAPQDASTQGNPFGASISLPCHVIGWTTTHDVVGDTHLDPGAI